MKCPYCGVINEPRYTQCQACGLWFLLQDQVRSWQRVIDQVADCISNEGHTECERDLERIAQEMLRVSK